MLLVNETETMESNNSPKLTKFMIRYGQQCNFYPTHKFKIRPRIEPEQYNFCFEIR